MAYNNAFDPVPLICAKAKAKTKTYAEITLSIYYFITLQAQVLLLGFYSQIPIHVNIARGHAQGVKLIERAGPLPLRRILQILRYGHW